MIGCLDCRSVEMWKWLGKSVGAETGRLGEFVNDKVCSLNGHCSGICGGTSYLTIDEHGSALLL